MTLLLRALRREPVDRAPVWLMRQAGRYLPEYREVRQRAGGFLEMAKSPELAAEVTLQPVRRFDVDAAIIFSDILLPLEAMGMPLVFDERGPSLPQPLRTAEDVSRLVVPDPGETMGFVGELLERVRAGLTDDKTLIGFCGAPFTLASYAIEGGTGKSFAALRGMMYREPALFETLMDLLAETVERHLRYQASRGAQVLVLFDTWAGTLTLEDYRRYAAPWARRVLAAMADVAPCVTYVRAGDHLLEDLADSGAAAVGLDWRTPIDDAFRRVGDRVALQGNLDPALLLGPPDEVARRTEALLDAVGGRPGHVLNLGHGVIKETDPESVAAFVRVAKERAR